MTKSTKKAASKGGLPFGIGDAVLIRTVTMIQVGRVRDIGPDYFVLEEAGWVALTKRFSVTLETGALDEFEKAPSWILVGRGSVVDIYPWPHKLPDKTI
jgi:hypothetical protein